jgi:hypothetical protein
MAEQATQSPAVPTVVINPSKGLRIYLLASKGTLDDGSQGTVHERLQLLPGANRVPAETWKRFGKECDGDIKGGRLSTMTKALSAYEERDALELVKNTIDMPLLKAFRNADKRKAVRKAIDNQMREITGKPRDADDDDSEVN